MCFISIHFYFIDLTQKATGAEVEEEKTETPAGDLIPMGEMPSASQQRRFSLQNTGDDLEVVTTEP